MARRALPAGARDGVERQAALHDGVQEDAEGPGVRGAAVVFLTDEHLGGGVVLTAAPGVEEGGGGGAGDPAAEAEVREGDGGGRVGLPIGGGEEGGGGDVDEDVWVVALACL